MKKNGDEIHVRIAEVKTGRLGEVLKVTLGSCVGILFKNKKTQTYGLAHCLLPKGHFERCEISAKYVDHAIESLIEILGIAKSEYAEIEVSIFGGANMMKDVLHTNISQVGLMNIESAKNKLNELGFSIVSEDVGGYKGRKIVVYTINNKVEIIYLDKVSKLNEAA